MVLYMFPFIGRFECTVIFCLFEDVPGLCERFRLVIPCACKTFSDFSLFIVKYHFSRLQEQTEFVFNVNIKLYYVSASLFPLYPCTRQLIRGYRERTSFSCSASPGPFRRRRQWHVLAARLFHCNSVPAPVPKE